MIITIILIVLGLIEYRFRVRFEYLKESSVFLIFYSAKKGVRKRILINLNDLL